MFTQPIPPTLHLLSHLLCLDFHVFLPRQWSSPCLLFRLKILFLHFVINCVLNFLPIIRGHIRDIIACTRCVCSCCRSPRCSCRRFGFQGRGGYSLHSSTCKCPI